MEWKQRLAHPVHNTENKENIRFTVDKIIQNSVVCVVYFIEMNIEHVIFYLLSAHSTKGMEV